MDACKQTVDCSALPSLPHSKIRLTVHLSEAVNDFHPLVARFHPQLRVQESCLLRGHFLKLSMFLFWVQKSLDCLTMWPLWQAAPHASKRWLTSWQGCGDNTALYGGKTVRPLRALGSYWVGGPKRCFHCWQHETKITGVQTAAHGKDSHPKSVICCTERPALVSQLSPSHWLVCHSAFLLL